MVYCSIRSEVNLDIMKPGGGRSSEAVFLNKLGEEEIQYLAVGIESRVSWDD